MRAQQIREGLTKWLPLDPLHARASGAQQSTGAAPTTVPPAPLRLSDPSRRDHSSTTDLRADGPTRTSSPWRAGRVRRRSVFRTAMREPARRRTTVTPSACEL